MYNTTLLKLFVILWNNYKQKNLLWYIFIDFSNQNVMLLQLFYGHLEIPYQTIDFCSYLQVLGYKPSSEPLSIELKDLRGWSQTVRETQRLNHNKWASEMVTTGVPCSQTLPFTSLRELLCLIIWVSIVMCGTWSSLSILLQK